MARMFTATNEIVNNDVFGASEIWADTVSEFGEDLFITLSAQLDKILLTIKGEDIDLIKNAWIMICNEMNYANISSYEEAIEQFNFNEIKEI
jgi:hypothetical protein